MGRKCWSKQGTGAARAGAHSVKATSGRSQRRPEANTTAVVRLATHQLLQSLDDGLEIEPVSLHRVPFHAVGHKHVPPVVAKYSSEKGAHSLQRVAVAKHRPAVTDTRIERTAASVVFQLQRCLVPQVAIFVRLGAIKGYAVKRRQGSVYSTPSRKCTSFPGDPKIYSESFPREHAQNRRGSS